MKDRISYGDPTSRVPRWFTYLAHLLSRRQCYLAGHQFSPGGTVCGHCGLLRELPADSAEPDKAP